MARRIAIVIIAAFVILAIVGLLRRPAHATLEEGKTAPLFTAETTLGEQVFTFDLADALKKGPVVLYFYPAAFTQGCTQEAHDFAENIDNYKKLGATVIGVSGDDIEKLKKFGTSECRSKFAIASDKDLAIAKSYDSTIDFAKNTYANRVSYVISREGKIVYVYSSLDPDKHVANTLAALRKLKKRS